MKGVRDKTQEMFIREKEGAIKDIQTSIRLYKMNYDRFIEFVNDAFLAFEDEEDNSGKKVGKSLLISYGGPTFYILRDCKGDFYWVFSWERTIQRKIKSGSKAELLVSELFDILEQYNV